MKLSDQLHQDFLKEKPLSSSMTQYPLNTYWTTRTYEMSYDYLFDLIEKVKLLEEKADRWNELMKTPCVLIEEPSQAVIDKAANWDMLERLPYGTGLNKEELHHNDHWFITKFAWADLPETIVNGKTPAEALKAYWESKK